MTLSGVIAMSVATRSIGGTRAGALCSCQNNLALNDSQTWSETVFLDQRSVSSYKIDELEELQCNWIGVLSSDWEIDSGSLSAVTGESLETRYLTIQELIPLTRQSRYELLALDQDYWVHTICRRVVGLGRVRLVLCFDNPEQIGECAVLATDRLDWSPRKVLTQWLQALPSERFDHQVSSRPAHSYSVPFTFTNYSAALTPAL
jgi:hypothetical protein